jgi:hypothetical protein
MTEPDLMHGVWGRRWVSIDGGPRFETQHVVWLQAGTCFADLRVPFHATAERRCFAGRSGWDGEQYRWRHRLDLESTAGAPTSAAEDIGDLDWEDGLVIERGEFPTATGSVPYEEAWARLPGGDGRFLALEGPDACLIRVGDHALTVVDDRAEGHEFAACYRVLLRGRWTEVAMIGDGDRLPGPQQPPPGWRIVHTGAADVVAV